jgi:hypothetical protein
LENRVNVSPEERNNPSTEQMDDLLEMLKEANDAGELVGFVFMLKNSEDEDLIIVDYRGSHEHVEIATRTVRERIRDEIQDSHPAIARQLTAELEAKVH